MLYSFVNVCHEKFQAEPKEEDEEWSTLQIKCSVAATSFQQACIIQDSTVAVNTGHCKSCYWNDMMEQSDYRPDIFKY